MTTTTISHPSLSERPLSPFDRAPAGPLRRWAVGAARRCCCLALVLGAGSLIVYSVAAEEPSLPTTEDLIAPIRAQVADPDRPFDIFIKITLIPGREAAFEEAFASRMAATRAEPGNILFELSVHPQMPNVYMLHERWANLAAVEAHMNLEHMQTFWPDYLPMIARVPEFEIYTTRDLAAGP